jgi:hypothetical protein
MLYPYWFPFPSCWLKALILEVSLIPLRIILSIVGESAFNALEVGWHSDPWRFWMWIVIAGVIAPIFVLGHIYQWLWGEPNRHLPKWMPSLKSWLEGLWSWFVCLITLAILLVVMFIWYDGYLPKTLSDEEANFLGIGFLIMAAYFYHFRVLMQQRIKQINK